MSLKAQSDLNETRTRILYSSLSDLSDGEDNTDGETQNAESENNDVTINYKKLLVGELRSIAENKGLTDNAKKLKKHELLELLEKDSDYIE